MEIEKIYTIALIIAGVALCFAGFKLQKLLAAVPFFILGAYIAGNIATRYIDEAWLVIVLQLIAGVVLSPLGFKLEKVAILIAVCCFTYTTLQLQLPDLHVAVKIIAALLCGGLSLLFIKPVFIICTSFIGEALMYYEVPLLVSVPKTVLLIVTLIIAIVGIIVQFKTNKE